MAKKPTYEELEQRVKELENEAFERKRAEEKFIKSEKLYKEAQSLAHIGYWDYEPHEDSLIWSDELYSIFEIDKDAGPVSIEVFIERIHPEDRDTIRGQVEKGESYRSEYRIVMDNGSVKHIREEVLIVRQEDGKIQIMKGTAQDITRQKQTEEALRKEKDFSESLIDTAQVIILVLDTEGRIVRFNPYMEELCGYKLDEVQGRDWFSTFLPEQDYDRIREVFRTAVSDVQTQGNINPIVAKDGSEIIAEWYDKTLKDTAGNTIGLLAIGQDITSRKRAEEALKESHNRFLLLMDSLDAAVYVVDMDTYEILFMNKYIRNLFGDRVGEICWKNFHEGQSGPCEFCTNDKLIDESGEPTGAIVWDTNNLKADGWWEMRDMAIRWTDGRIVRLEITSDISARKQAEEALRESEERYRTLIETITDMVFIISPNGNLAYINPEFEKLTGFPVQDSIGHSFTEVLAPEYIESTVDRFKRGLSGETIPVYEVELKHKDGKTVPVELKVTSLLDDDGKTIGRIGLARDISERKKADRALTESEERYRSVFENTGTATIIIEDDMTISMANAEYEKLVGFSNKEVENKKKWTEFVVEEDLERMKEYHIKRRGNDKNIPTEYEFRIADRQGNIKDVYIKIGIIPGTAKSVASMVDITPLKRTREALNKSETEKKAILDGITTTIRLVDENLEILWVNKAGSASVNKSPEEMIGHKCYEFWGDHEKTCANCPAIKTFREKKTNQIIRHAPDGKVWDLKTEPVVDDKGSLVGVVEIAHDITDKSRLEAQLQQALKMEAMGTLAGGIAHDFNNLLMAIQGRASIMLMKKDSSDPDIGHLKGIEDNIESAADLTRQLLGFARGGKYEVRPTDLNELIKKQNRMFGRTKKEVTIRGKYEENLWSVEVDRGQIEQVFLNLYVNAWQAMPGGGDLNLETENVTLDENYVKPFSIEPGRYVKISVTDTGVGMDKATQERIFEPFFTTKEMGRGTGLGLASVYGIIKNHGGFINVYSETGHGTTFNVYLPASEKEVIEEKKPAGNTLWGTETVLFVDDEDMIIEIAEELFEQLGYKVLIARSGKEAIETYEKNKDHIDIVLLDMIMPDMSGSDTYDRMKEIDPDIKVLLSSGYSINGQATEILDRGCDGFIQKPFNMKELSQKLREILDESENGVSP